MPTTTEVGKRTYNQPTHCLLPVSTAHPSSQELPQSYTIRRLAAPRRLAAWQNTSVRDTPICPDFSEEVDSVGGAGRSTHTTLDRLPC